MEHEIVQQDENGLFIVGDLPEEDYQGTLQLEEEE